jgi:hypothetical protein
VRGGKEDRCKNTLKTRSVTPTLRTWFGSEKVSKNAADMCSRILRNESYELLYFVCESVCRAADKSVMHGVLGTTGGNGPETRVWTTGRPPSAKRQDQNLVSSENSAVTDWLRLKRSEKVEKSSLGSWSADRGGQHQPNRSKQVKNSQKQAKNT